MNTLKNTAWMVCGAPGLILEPQNLLPHHNYNLKTILITQNDSAGAFKAAYPQAEVVFDESIIMRDTAITFVVVSDAASVNRKTIRNLMAAGKQVQIL